MTKITVKPHVLHVDPEFKALIPPLKPAERDALEAAIVAEGRARDPIVHWRSTIIDGHNRYEICTRLGLPFTIVAAPARLKGREDVRQWIYGNQCARRSLTREQLLMLAAMNDLEPGPYHTHNEITAARKVARRYRDDLAIDVLEGRYTLRQAMNRVKQREAAPVARGKRAPVTASAPVDPFANAETKRGEARVRAERNLLLDQLREAKGRQRVLDALDAPPMPGVIPAFPRGARRRATPVVMASDWHVEEPVTLAQSQGRNEYSLAIAEHSIGRFFAGIRWLNDMYRTNFDISAMVLALAGDLITGYIHDELVENNALSPTEAIVWLRDRLISGIRFLLEDPLLDNITIPCSYGNHGRTTEKRRIATGAANSYEWLLYQVLKAEFANEPRVQFVVDQTAHQYVQAGKFTLHFHHGDEIGYGGGVGGIGIPVNKRVPQWDRVRRAHYHHIGHFHQLIDLGHTIVNGSMIGYNSFAMSIGATFEEPRQAYYLLDAERGKTCVTPLWVRETRETREVEAA